MRDPLIARVLAQAGAKPIDPYRVARFWWFALWLGTLVALVIIYADWSRPIGSQEFLRPVGAWPWVRFPFACSTIMVLIALDSGVSNDAPLGLFLRFVLVSNAVAVLVGVLGLPSVPLERIASARHLLFLAVLTTLHLLGFTRVEYASSKRFAVFENI